MKSLLIATRRHLAKLQQTTEQTGDDFLLQQLQSFEQRLMWHCSFVQMVENYPMMHTEPLDSRFDGVRIQNSEMLLSFANGKTGIPFVDACMRSLKQTGWINFKQRAMLASFACNTLLLDWQEVGKTLAHLFVDYDPAIHWSQIQLQSGINPRHHIPFYDVIKQGHMHDERGDFIKLYIPELRHIPPSDIHEPWKLAENPYLSPIIDIEQAFKDNKKLLYGIKKKVN